MKKIVFLCVALTLAACSATSQDARISLSPVTEQSNIGRGSYISISVEDARQSPVIGTYGGGAPITTSQNLADTIGKALVDSYTKHSFNVTGSRTVNTTQMNVYLEGLTYTYNGHTISSSATTTSRVRVEVPGKGFNRTYTNSEDRTIPFAANQDTNNSQLSSTLRAMVEKIVSDEDLADALRR